MSNGETEKEKLRIVPKLHVEREGHYEIRNIEGPRKCLNWQVGVLLSENRHYRDPGMFAPFQASVTLFKLVGYGETRSEAIAMAKGRK